MARPNFLYVYEGLITFADQVLIPKTAMKKRFAMF